MTHAAEPAILGSGWLNLDNQQVTRVSPSEGARPLTSLTASSNTSYSNPLSACGTESVMDSCIRPETPHRVTSVPLITIYAVTDYLTTVLIRAFTASPLLLHQG